MADQKVTNADGGNDHRLGILDPTPERPPLSRKQARFRIHLVFYFTLAAFVMAVASLVGSWWFLQSAREMGLDWGWEAVRTRPTDVAGVIVTLVLAIGVLRQSRAAAMLLVGWQSLNVLFSVSMQLGLGERSFGWPATMFAVAYLFACTEAFRAVKALERAGPPSATESATDKVAEKVAELAADWSKGNLTDAEFYRQRDALLTPDKQCPFCAETIKADAIACRFCGRDFPLPSTSQGA